MNEHYPRIRRHFEDGRLALREGLILCFFMRHPHVQITQAVFRSLQTYLQAIAPNRLGGYVGTGMEQWEELDESTWLAIQRALQEPQVNRAYSIDLSERPDRVGGYHFEYQGVTLEPVLGLENPRMTCMVSFWLPTEYLEEHGPARVRNLALELSRELPFCSGYADLAFNHLTEFMIGSIVKPLAFRYPGMDIHRARSSATSIGTRIRGVHWLNFLGQPVLGELGGAAGLREQLPHPDISIQEMDGDRVLITLGEWPAAGDTEAGNHLPLHRQLARVLEPWLYEEPRAFNYFSKKDMLRWHRRFLDDPPPAPPPR